MQIPVDLIGWLFFALIQIVNLPLTWIGLVILAPMSYFRLWIERPSRIYPERTVTAWRGGWLTFLWSNEEDGVTGSTWNKVTEATGQSRWQVIERAYYWSAIRNPVNNLRFVPGVSFLIDPAKVQTVFMRHGYRCRQGWRPYIVLVFGDYYVHAGWRMDPASQAGDLAWPVFSAGKLS